MINLICGKFKIFGKGYSLYILAVGLLFFQQSLMSAEKISPQTLANTKQQTLLEKGKSLFANPALSGSTTSQSCQSCHEEGAGIEFACDNPKIIHQINRCITVGLKGKALMPEGEDMKALKAYVCSFGNEM